MPTCPHTEGRKFFFTLCTEKNINFAQKPLHRRHLHSCLTKSLLISWSGEADARVYDLDLTTRGRREVMSGQTTFLNLRNPPSKSCLSLLAMLMQNFYSDMNALSHYKIYY